VVSLLRGGQSATAAGIAGTSRLTQRVVTNQPTDR
jgi:hypothetical protein